MTVDNSYKDDKRRLTLDIELKRTVKSDIINLNL